MLGRVDLQAESLDGRLREEPSERELGHPTEDRVVGQVGGHEVGDGSGRGEGILRAHELVGMEGGDEAGEDVVAHSGVRLDGEDDATTGLRSTRHQLVPQGVGDIRPTRCGRRTSGRAPRAAGTAGSGRPAGSGAEGGALEAVVTGRGGLR